METKIKNNNNNKVPFYLVFVLLYFNNKKILQIHPFSLYKQLNLCGHSHDFNIHLFPPPTILGPVAINHISF